MKQIFYKYYLWEDYNNGMYDSSIIDFDIMVSNSILLLSNEVSFFNTGIELLNNWKISSDVNLSNIYCNRRAWVGQASCSYKYGSNEIATREAWSRLTNTQRISANLIADKIINIYENKNKKLYCGMGKEMLF